MDWTKIVLEKPEIIVTVLSGFLLPIILVWLNNFYNLRLKNKEKELDQKFNANEELRKQEKAVYASLSKVLFDVQQLHVSLSGSCIDEDCINRAVIKFDESATKYHDEISNDLLYMPSEVINDIYRFYGKLSDLKINLKEFNDSKNFEVAHVFVYYFSSELAGILIDLQDRLLRKRSNLQIEFDRTKQEMMKHCCGTEPSQELLDKYLVLQKQLNPTFKIEK
jgi:hypothetical protein